MGLLPATGQRSTSQRLIRAGILTALTVGGLVMAMPFLLMFSGATRTGVDAHAFSLIPRFLTNDTVLYQKYIEAKYNESPALLRATWEVDVASFDEVTLLSDPEMERVAAWTAFLDQQEIRPEERFAGFSHTPSSRSRPWLVRQYLNHQRDKTDGDLARLNERLHTTFPSWNAFQVLPPDGRTREGYVENSPWWRAWFRFVNEDAPAWSTGIHNLSGFYHERVTRTREGRDAPRISWREAPTASRENFLRGMVHPAFLHLSEEADEEWRTFLQRRHGSLQGLEQATGIAADSWREVPLPTRYRDTGALQADWLAFVEGWLDLEDDVLLKAPADSMSLQSVELAWRRQTGTAPPFRERDQQLFRQHRSDIRRVFLTQNFAATFELLIRDGRGLWVTLVYCAGSVLLALVVNPLAAYALSRFRPKHTYTILLYLLLTMAFPPMVTQIPLFLMLRDFGMLNSFWALWLPGMVHGYSIFLLKGFFDSLPRDLYESASLDGASELRMFTTITMSLSKPILAVIALQAFVTAYTAFMFALLICQDPRMWTLMVWLYQLQQTYGPGVQNAAYVLAAIPTLLAFLLAQRHILKGIVIPTEK